MGMEDACFPDQPIQARNYFLACYAASLVKGETILGGTIRLRTLRHYLTDAYELFRMRKLSYKSFDGTDYIDVIVSAVKKYESVANRRNMITDDMMHWLIKYAASSHIDGNVAAIVDWIILGRFTGFRKSEWCQSSLTSYDLIPDWPVQAPMAMILSDFTFFDQNERRLSIPANATFDNMIQITRFIRIRWRHQKNGDNGEEITFQYEPDNQKVCPVRAALRIYLRALRLKVPSDQPIGVFRQHTKSNKTYRRFITDTLTQKLLRQAASEVLNIKDTDPELKLWSTHSIRVTAANLLHRAKMTDSFIQKRLRWKSNSFLMYLRNTIYAASEHTKALNITDYNLPPKAERAYRKDEPHEVIFA